VDITINEQHNFLIPIMKNTGLLIIILSILVFTVDRMTQFVSTFLGKLICGDRYLQAVNGVVGDASCGFNMDMYLSACLLGLFIIGLVLVIISRNDTGDIYLKI